LITHTAAMWSVSGLFINKMEERETKEKIIRFYILIFSVLPFLPTIVKKLPSYTHILKYLTYH